MEHLLQWNPDGRPTAQQALKYTFFQISVRTTDTGYISLPDAQVAHHQNQMHFNTRKTSLQMRYNSLDNEQWQRSAFDFGGAGATAMGERPGGDGMLMVDGGGGGDSALDAAMVVKEKPAENGECGVPSLTCTLHEMCCVYFILSIWRNFLFHGRDLITFKCN